MNRQMIIKMYQQVRDGQDPVAKRSKLTVTTLNQVIGTSVNWALIIQFIIK